METQKDSAINTPAAPAPGALAGGALHTSAPGAEAGHYLIGDLARDFGVTLRALRFYEDKGLLRPSDLICKGPDRRRPDPGSWPSNY